MKRARDRRLGMPVCPGLVEPSWLESNGLVPLAEQPPLLEQLWLLLTQGAMNTKAARQCLRLLRAQLAKAQAMRDPHGNLF